MRRPVLVLVVVLAAIGAFTGGLAMLLDTPRPRSGATKGEALYLALWRAALFLVRPGDLSNAATMGQRSDKYLFDLIKHGGAPIGRPGMPAFGSTLTDEEIAEVVRYARGLARPR
jgi:hypothetical protein